MENNYNNSNNPHMNQYSGQGHPNHQGYSNHPGHYGHQGHSERRKAPGWVRVIAVLYYISFAIFALFSLIGLISIFGVGGQSLALSSFGGAFDFLAVGGAVLVFLVLVAVTVLMFLMARGLNRGKNWARITAIVFSGLSVLFLLFGLFQDFSLFNVIILGINLAIGGYLLFSSSVKDFFAK